MNGAQPILFKNEEINNCLKDGLNFKFNYLQCPDDQVEPKSHDILPEYSQY